MGNGLSYFNKQDYEAYQESMKCFCPINEIKKWHNKGRGRSNRMEGWGKNLRGGSWRSCPFVVLAKSLPPIIKDATLMMDVSIRGLCPI